MTGNDRRTTIMKATRRINVREAAAYIGSSKSKMDKWRCYGGGPKYYRLDHKIVYDVVDLDAFLAERARTNTSQNVAA
jgi:hypothetical protein